MLCPDNEEHCFNHAIKLVIDDAMKVSVRGSCRSHSDDGAMIQDPTFSVDWQNLSKFAVAISSSKALASMFYGKTKGKWKLLQPNQTRLEQDLVCL